MSHRVTDIGKGLRMAKILVYLMRHKNRPLTASEVRAFLQSTDSVSLRNVQRDLKHLADNQPHTCVMQTRRGGKVAYCIEPNFAAKFGVPIEKNALLGLFLLKQLQPFFAPDASNLEEMGEAIAEMGSVAGYELFEDLDDQLQDKIFQMGDHSTLSLTDTMLNSVLTALTERRKLSITYSRGGEEQVTEKVICPAKLVLSKGELYLICMSEYHKDRDYYIKLNRISEVKVTDDKFAVDPARIARIEKRLADSFGILDANIPKPKKVVLSFPGYLEKVFREKKFHRSQTVTRNRKGDAIVSMTVPIGMDLVRWVLGWGEDATVVGPAELRSQIKEMGRELVKKYG